MRHAKPVRLKTAPTGSGENLETASIGLDYPGWAINKEIKPPLRD